MQLWFLLNTLLLHQLNQPGKGALGMHHLKDLVIFAVPTVVQEKGSDYVERGIIIFLHRCQPHKHLANMACLLSMRVCVYFANVLVTGSI